MRYVFSLLLLLTLTGTASAQGAYPYQQSFQLAYQQHPTIPRGMLEAISHTQTHIRHVMPDEAAGCSGIPQYVGVMGLIEDGKGVFRENMALVVALSGYPKQGIMKSYAWQMWGFAKAYDKLNLQLGPFDVNDPTAHIPILIALSELPLNDTDGDDFALNSYCYSVLSFLNDPVQQRYGFPAYQMDLRRVFGPNYDVLSSSQIIISPQGITNGQGQQYSSSRLAAEYPGALWNPAASCNYGSRNGTAITAVTVHTVQGSYAGCISWFQNCNAGVSAHYVIRSSDGQVTQMVPEANRAYHVGSENPYTVGIEHEGYVNDASWYTPAMYQSSANLVKYLAGKYTINPLSTYKGSAQVVLSACYRIKGHIHYPNQSHTDPGVNWNWPLYHNLINNTIATTRIATCTGTFTDNGGTTGNYTDLTKYLTIIEPVGAASVTMNFTSFSTEAGYDSLYIYDGAGTGGTLLGRYTGTQNPGTVTTNSGTMSLLFTSDCSINSTGWSATWSCAACPGSLALAVDSLMPVTCNPGYIRVAASGGTPPYTYVWGNGTPGPERTNMPVGSFTVSVTDGAGCTVSQVFAIPSTPNPTVQLIATALTCYGDDNATVTAIPTAGTLPYSYTWNVAGGNTNTVLNASAGTYTVTLTDGAGCTATATTVITQPDSLIIVTDSLSDATCYGGYIAVSATGGSGTQTYLWNDGNNTATRSGLIAGSYTVTVTDAVGCTATATTVITPPDSLTILTDSLSDATCYGGYIAVSGNGGTGTQTYLWNDGNNTAIRSGLIAGNYTVTATDAVGCTASKGFVINNRSSIAITATVDTLNCPGDADASITATAAGGSGPFSYLWNTGSTSAQINNLATGIYSVTATDANGCLTSQTILVDAPDSIRINATAAHISCYGFGDGTILVTPSNGLWPYQYQWGNGLIVDSIAGLEAGAYAVTITDSRGCTATESYTLTEPSPLALWGVYPNSDTTDMAWDSVTGGMAPYTVDYGCFIPDIIGGPALECYLQVADANGCAVDSSFSFGLWSSMGEVQHSPIAIYPNPTSGLINIEWQAEHGFVRYWLMNTLGQVLVENALTPHTATLQLDLSPFAMGTYWIVLENKEGRKALPVVRD